jgi:lipoate-protein ligase A
MGLTMVVMQANGFVEPHPDFVQPQPGGPEDPLGESVLDPALPWLRVYEPKDLRLVLGRSQDPHKELNLSGVQAAQVPVHRRATGGGAVVLAPGMVVVALRLQRPGLPVDQCFDLVNDALVPAVAAVSGGVAPLRRGHGDLAMDDGAGPPRKILGASLRQTARLTAYLGVFLVADAVPLMEPLLAFPSRQPDYRGGRGHGAFCTHLGRWGVTVSALIKSLEVSCQDRLGHLAQPKEPLHGS